MFRLVYYSANRIIKPATGILAQIEQILVASRRNNAKVAVTGALMFSEDYFGQVLEGPQAAVEATFERIQRDARHGDVSLLEFSPIEKRSFGCWSMAYVGDLSSARQAFAAIALETGYDADRLKAEKLLNRLVELVQGETV
jgi:hypothetical protein